MPIYMSEEGQYAAKKVFRVPFKNHKGNVL